MDVKILIALIFFGLISCSESVKSLEESETKEHLSGTKFYKQRCAICHGDNGKLGVSEAKDLSESKLTNQQIEEIVEKGKGAMPPFGHSIESDSTLIELVEHIKTLRE